MVQSEAVEDVHVRRAPAGEPVIVLEPKGCIQDSMSTFEQSVQFNMFTSEDNVSMS